MVAMTEEERPPQVIQEQIDPQLIESLFRNYKSGTEALLELIDNSVDETIRGSKLTIEVKATGKEISVVERGGPGMDFAGLQRFFRWGRSEKAGQQAKLGRYGQGGKAAMGYLGRSFTLIAKAAGSDDAYELVEPNWDDRSTGIKTWVPRRLTIQCPRGEGYVEIRITNRNNPKIKGDVLREKLGNVYRELLRDGRCEIIVDGTAATPLDLPLYDKNPVQQIDVALWRGQRVSGWFGRLKADTAKHGRLKGGIRCTVNGRLIQDGEFFGHPTPQFKQSLNQLIGVVEVPSPPVPLNMNKTDFDRDSKEWEQLSSLMHQRLEAIVRELKGAHEQEKVSESDRKRVFQAEALFQAAVQRLDVRDLVEAKFNTRVGQQPREQQRDGTGSSGRKPRSDIGGTHSAYSSPPENAVGNRKRKGPMKWEPKILAENTRALIAVEAGESVLFINTKFPLYKLTKGDLWYLVETGALELAKYEHNADLTPDGYLEQVNEILAEAFAEHN